MQAAGAAGPTGAGVPQQIDRDGVVEQDHHRSHRRKEEEKYRQAAAEHLGDGGPVAPGVILEERLDTATVRPTAVRAMMTENTGMMSWYSPMTSAPISRESRMRYTNREIGRRYWCP